MFGPRTFAQVRVRTCIGSVFVNIEGAMRPAEVIVVGSLNQDLVARAPHLPRPGETVAAHRFARIAGGKGGNQAVAAARMGATVAMIGRVGDDAEGEALRCGLSAEGIDIAHVQATSECSSGLALITVEDSGENAITVVPGANARLSADDVQAAAAVFAGARVVLAQLETPWEVVQSAFALGRQHGALCILDPAPAPTRALPRDLWEVDILTPNQSETEALLGRAVSSSAIAHEAAVELCNRGARASLLKLAADGALLHTADGPAQHFRPPAVTAVDTTAAGDAFTGALAARLAAGDELPDAVRAAVAAGALAVTRHGAQPAMPTRDEVERQLKA